MKMAEEKKKKKLLDRLKVKYRMVLLNDDSFAEKFSFRLSALNVFIATGVVSIVMIALVTSIIAFTPLREFIPGYASDIATKRDLIALSIKTDSLAMAANARELYIRNLTDVLNGNSPPPPQKVKGDSTKKYKNIKIKNSREDSAFRKGYEAQDRYTLSISASSTKGRNSIAGFFFFAPVRGKVTESFSTAREHYGADIAASENEPVKATLDGTVIFAGWTSESGNVIQIQHSNNLVSVYKHNSALLKKTGEYVKAGEPIAIVGNTGEQSNGPHLHFELWYNGSAIDPQDYIVF
jgi:murein DD-endopeptidase MepM/ murein hydrolase activator NlpD